MRAHRDAAALRERLQRFAQARREILRSGVDTGVAEQWVDRHRVEDSLGGEKVRFRRGSVLHDRRVSLPDDLRAAGLEFSDISERAAQLGGFRSCLDFEPRGRGSDRPIQDRARTRLVVASMVLDDARRTLRQEPADLPLDPAWSRWDLWAVFGAAGVTFAAVAGSRGSAAKALRERLRLELQHTLRRLGPFISRYRKETT
ncbi:MAG: hypothetical protein AAFR16_00275 [Pseudomonadota bacterium]